MLFYVDVEDNEAFIVFICNLLSPLGTFVQELKVKFCTLSSTEVKLPWLKKSILMTRVIIVCV